MIQYQWTQAAQQWRSRNAACRNGEYMTEFIIRLFVKDYKELKPEQIFKEFEKEKIPLNNLTKKYIAMYWLIRDKI